MLVFIDESGDPGFRVPEGSSSLFVIGMVIFHSAEAALRCQNEVSKLALQLGQKPEFKFSTCRDATRDAFFQCVRSHDFQFRCVVVEKSRVWSPHLRSNNDQFYNYFIKLLLKHDGGLLQRAKVIVDGSGSRQFQSNLKTYVRREVSSDVISSIRMRDSKSDRLLQLADMCVGSVYRARRGDAKQSSRWLNQLGPRVSNLWDFR